jgi:hypothetical protein
MFPSRYFNPKYWASRFWAKVGLTPVVVEPDDVTVLSTISLNEVTALSLNLRESTTLGTINLEEVYTCQKTSRL